LELLEGWRSVASPRRSSSASNRRTVQRWSCQSSRFFAAATLATLSPVIRAVRIDPATTLRTDWRPAIDVGSIPVYRCASFRLKPEATGFVASAFRRKSNDQEEQMASAATVANQRQILANQRRILANQRRIEANQSKLDRVLRNQGKLDRILANQKRILSKLR
jgi:hypothetical protein